MKKKLAWIILILFAVLVIGIILLMVVSVVVREPIMLVAFPISALLLWAIYMVTKG